MSRARSLLGDVLVLAFGSLGGRILGILLLPLYTRVLTPGEFGTVDLMTTSIDLLLPLVFLSISEAVLRFAMLAEERSKDVIRTALTFVGSGAGVCLISAGVVFFLLPDTYLTLLLLIFSLQAITSVLGAWGKAIGRVRVYALSGIVQAAAIGLSNIALLAGVRLGVEGFLLSLAIGNVAAICVLVVRLPLLGAIRSGAFQRTLLRRMLLFSVPLVPNVVFWWLISVSGRYFLALSHGVDQVGLFSVASRFPALVTVAATVFSQAWQLSANRSVDDHDRGSYYSTVFRHYAAMLLLSVSSIVLLLKPLVSFVSPPAYFDAWQATPPLLIAAVFAAFASFYGAIYTAARQTSGIFRTTIAAAALSVLFNVALVPSWGVSGAAVSIALCFLGLWSLRVVGSQPITATTMSGRLVVPALAILVLQSLLQYVPISRLLAYLLMMLAWLLILLLFRRELREVSVLSYRALRGFATSRRSSSLGIPREEGASASI